MDQWWIVGVFVSALGMVFSWAVEVPSGFMGGTLLVGLLLTARGLARSWRGAFRMTWPVLLVTSLAVAATSIVS